MTVQTPLGAPAIGTYRWHRRSWRRWSGHRWVEATYSAFPKRLGRQREWASYPELPPDNRQELLELAVDREVRAGASVVQRGDDGVTLAYRRTVTHLGHLVLTLMTFGLWGFVWLYVAVGDRESRIRFEVDPWGNVWPVAA